MYSTTDVDITIYTRKAHKSDPVQDKWVKVHISGVSWYGGQGVRVHQSGLEAEDGYKVRIPENKMPKGYMPPTRYAASGNSENWTVKNGDIVVRGILEDEITSPKDITGKYDDVFIATSWKDNRRGPAMARHMLIEGK